MSVALSIVGHLALTAGVALAPALAARERQPFEFVQVQIVPLQALGVPEPIVQEPRAEAREPRPPAPVVTSEERERPAETRQVVAEPAESERPRRSEPAEAESAATGESGLPQRRGSPQGSPLATSPFGTAVAGFDNPDFVYGYYVEQMLAMIGKNWVRPSVAGDVEMMIHFRISDDGELSEIEIVEPSGHPSFDLAGERAVRLASPLPPLPKSFPHDSLGVNLIIR